MTAGVGWRYDHMIMSKRNEAIAKEREARYQLIQRASPAFVFAMKCLLVVIHGHQHLTSIPRWI